MTADQIRNALRGLDLVGLLDVASTALHLIRERATADANRLRDLNRVLRAHGIDPESPTAAHDLDLRLRSVAEVTDQRDRLASGAERVISALVKVGRLSAKDAWHSDAACLIRDYAVLRRCYDDLMNEAKE